MMDFDLSEFALFDALSKSDLDILQGIMAVEKNPPQHVFLSEGERGAAVTSHLYLILEGTVTVSAKIDAKADTELRMMREGQFFGLVSFLDDGRRSATYTAKTEVTTARLSRAPFNALFQLHGDVHARIQMAVAQQLAGDIRVLEGLLVDAANGKTEGIRKRFQPS
jgi:CRP/FNR family cyclic AMP-dependent transcriptional regulator